MIVVLEGIFINIFFIFCDKIYSCFILIYVINVWLFDDNNILMILFNRCYYFFFKFI